MSRGLQQTGFGQITRYYLTGAVNTAVGFALYALFVSLGLGIFAAQLFAHLIGMCFNYVSYRRAVFRASAPAPTRFVLSYALNYLMSLAVLALVSPFAGSPYGAGLATILIVSLINYVVLKHLVFVRKLPG